MIVDNVMTIVAIGIGLSLYIESQGATVPVEKALALIFGLLSTMVIADFITKIKYMNKFKYQLEHLLEKTNNENSKFVKEIPMEEEMNNSVSVCILANTGYKTIGSNDDACEKLLKKGGVINVIIMNPSEQSAATIMAESRSITEFNADYYRSRINNTIKELYNVRKKIRKKGGLNVMLCEIAPSFGLYIFNPDSKNGRMYIRTFSHYESLNKNINIFISKSKEPDVFNHYYNQFNLIRGKSNAIDLEKYFK